MSNELYEVLQKDNDELKGQNTWANTELNRNFMEYLAAQTQPNYLFYIHGMGGSGKSYLVKNWKENLDQECFSAYVDLSDCGEESDVYYKIARELQAYYSKKTPSGSDREKSEKLGKVIRIYEWITGIYRSGLSYATNAENITSNVVNIVSQEMEKVNEDGSGNGVWELLFKLTDKIPYVKQLKWMIDTLIDIKNIKKKADLKKELVKVLSEVDNRVMREQLFLNELVNAMPEETKKVIILDNFQLNQGNDLGRDHEWLDQEGKLMDRVEAFWVVASRGGRGELFHGRFAGQNIGEQEVTGFTQETARAYLRENCVFPTAQDDTEVAEGDYIKAMREACYYGGENVAEEDRTYLPYLLRLIVLYYWNLQEDVSRPVKPEMFVNLHEEHVFVGYYFYKDLSDLMINAFQILSCLSTWDDTWIDKVREKFDNHLLNAKNLLMHKAPIEELDGNGFKLHEAIKEALYQNEQNYIKKDVLEFLYESFIEIYNGDSRKPLDRVWGDLNRIQDYLQVVFEYIKMQPDQPQKKEKLKRIRGAVERIYNANKERGTVSQRFIEVYQIYIKKLNEVLNPDVNGDKEELILDKKIEYNEDTIYYVGCFLKLADLYTNKDGYETAQAIELSCVKFWDEQKSKIDNDEDIRYYRCWLQKIRALNAVAYDASAMHEYEVAYENGRKGLDEVVKLGNACIEKLVLQQGDESAKKLTDILNVEQKLELKQGIGQLSEEKCIDDLEVLYEMLQEWRDKESSEKGDSYVKVLYELIFEVQQNLRGNYPWYCLNVSRFALPEEEEEINLKEENSEQQIRYEPYSFGIHTYWMRRAVYRVLDKRGKAGGKNGWTEKMLTSYHNICVYLFKSKETEAACLLEKEVMAERKRLIEPEDLNEKVKIFLDNVDKGNVDELPMWLWKQLKLDKESGKALFSLYAGMIESMEYLGDYYATLGLYPYAREVLKRVMLYRVIQLDTMDSKTLDTTFCFLKAYRKQKDMEVPKELATHVDNLLQRADGLLETDKADKRGSFISAGVREKLKELKKLRQEETFILEAHN